MLPAQRRLLAPGGVLSICGRRATLRLHARSASLFAGAGAGTGSWDGRAQRFGRHRFLSTTSDDKDTKSRTDDEDALVRFKKFVVSRYGAASGAALLATGMSYAAWKVVSKMMAINFTHVGMAGFVVGFGSCAATTFMLYGLYRQTYIRPERAFNTAVSLISSDEAVAKIMGNTIIKPLRGGDVRAYRMQQGRFFVDRETTRIAWDPPKLDMIFQIYCSGSSEQAVAVVSAFKSGRSIEYTSIAVDSLTNPGVSAMVVGSEADAATEMRSLVTLTKKYVNNK